MKSPFSMRHRSGRGGASLAVSVAVSLALVVVAPVRAQRPAPKPTPPAASTSPASAAAVPAAAQTPPAEMNPSVTFDTLLSADAYGIYAEMRMLGRHANSQEFAQLLTPFTLEGSGAPAELLALYEFV